jgi:DNA-binding winged helix-turn-helix (wHTH) protein
LARGLLAGQYDANIPLATHPIYRFGEYEVDSLARTLRRGDAVVSLSRRSFDLLLYFVQNSGRILSKDELLKKIWPDSFVDENSLAKSISVLRKALNENPLESTLVVTVPGRGYQFTAVVELAGPLARTEDGAISASGAGAIGVVVQRRHLSRAGLLRHLLLHRKHAQLHV